jgi:hypothetical protein
LSKQYVVIKDDEYLTKTGWTSSLSRAKTFSKKKDASLAADQNGGEVKTVYFSFSPPKQVIDKVWTVEFICQIRGLQSYGPFFTHAEADALYRSIKDGQKGPMFCFTDEFYGLMGNPIMTQSVNKLGDTLAIRETRRVV